VEDDELGANLQVAEAAAKSAGYCDGGRTNDFSGFPGRQPIPV
jgi:hypothetical protein